MMKQTDLLLEKADWKNSTSLSPGSNG